MKKFEFKLQIMLGIDNPDIETELPLCLFTITVNWVYLLFQASLFRIETKFNINFPVL